MRLAVAFLSSVVFAQAPQPTGIWEGALEAGGMKLRIAVHIGAAPGGDLKATIDSIDQNVKGIPVSAVIWESPSLRLALPAMRATFVATIDEAGQTLTGQWSQAGQSLPLTLRRVEKVTELSRPQTPLPPFPYREQPVTVRNAEGTELAGTLTLPPPGTGVKFPAALLLSGSGPQDRDASMFGHKPFLVLADALTRQGFAVLRLDDRGTAKSKGDFRSATTADFRDDASAALDFLRSRESIDSARIGLIGHSEGALVAAMLAASRPDDVAFLVSLAGPGIPFDQLLIEQGEAVLRASGAPADAIAKQRKSQEAMFPLLLGNKSSFELKTEIEKALSLDELPPSERAVADIQVSQSLSPWFRALLAIDAAKFYEKVRCPVLAINGSNDTQVVAESNLKGIAAALKRGGNSAVDVFTAPGVNHLLQTSKSGSPSEYPNIEETVAPTVLERLTKWLAQFVSR